MTMKNKKLREEIKKEFLNHNYKSAIELTLEQTSDQETKKKINKQINKLENIQKSLKNKEIDNESFYYGINEIVMEVLNTVDTITGEPDDDWDFIDELTSSLKYNLVDQDESEIYNSQVEMAKVQDDGKVVFEYELNEKDKDNSFDTLKKLYQQLNYYEKKESETDDAAKKDEIRNIIDAIKTRISQVSSSTME